MATEYQESFIKLKQLLMNIDPVNFCENNLTLDGEPFRLSGNGYAPFSDIYRYIGVKALERTSKPVILVKGRQVGGTTMAAALELYFMCSGLFGTKEKPPIRVMHVFPTLQHSKPYSKTKLNAMIAGAKPSSTNDKKGKPKSVIQELIDTSSESNNSLEFKQFLGGNHLWIESTGLEGDRLRGRTGEVMFLDEFQDTNPAAVSNVLKCLSQAKYGPIGEGVQVYFGTPKAKGSNYHKMWNMSTRQLYYLGCENCKEFFPLYTPESDEWENIWLYGYIVKCTHCGHEQDKRQAAERGKWVMPEGIDPINCKFVGFHINQLYIPSFTKEYILSQKPENDPNKTDKDYRNEVMGEFFQGDSSTITREEILEFCGDVGRKFRGKIMPGDEQMMVLGIDYGARSDAEQLAKPDMTSGGKSFSTAVVLSAKGPNLLHVEFAKKFHRNDFESKKGIIDQIMRQYSINIAIGDIGFSHDFSGVMHQAHGDRYLVSRAMPSNVNKNIKFREDVFPKEIQFDRNYYIEEMFDMMRKGQIRFPLGDYEKVAWLIDHCSSMSVKVSLSETGEHKIKYVKGGKPNDGFMALINAYIGYKYLLTNKFTTLNPFVQQQNFQAGDKPLIIGGYMSF